MKTVQDPRTGVTLALPDAWRLAHTGLSLYCDPETPQYTLLISFERLAPDWLQQSSLLEYARLLCSENPLARAIQVESVSEDRVLASYRSKGLEQGLRKDDFHWLILEGGEAELKVALLTLSVLAERAEPEETAMQARIFAAEASRLVFPELSPEPLRPRDSLQEQVDLLEDVTLSLCQGLCDALEGAPIDKQGLLAAAIGIGLYWLSRWKAPFDESVKETLSERLRLQVITSFCASLSDDSSKTSARFAELEPAMTRQSQAVIEPLRELFESAEDLSDDGLERGVIAFGLKLLLLTTTLFRDAPLEPEALAAQAERIQKLGRVVMAAPTLINEALCPQDSEASVSLAS